MSLSSRACGCKREVEVEVCHDVVCVVFVDADRPMYPTTLP